MRPLRLKNIYMSILFIIRRVSLLYLKTIGQKIKPSSLFVWTAFLNVTIVIWLYYSPMKRSRDMKFCVKLALVCYSLTSLVATDATSDCFVRPAASQVFLPIWIAEDKPRDSQDSTSCPPRDWRSTDENKTNQHAVALLWHWEKSYFETSWFAPTLSGP